MEIIRIPQTSTAKTIEKRRAAKNAFLKKLRKELVRQDDLATPQARTQEEKRPDNINIHISYAREQVFNRFLQNTRLQFLAKKNVEKLTKMITSVEAELQVAKNVVTPPPKEVKVLTIVYHDGVIRPARNVEDYQDYHWAFKDGQEFIRLTNDGDSPVQPNLTSGFVRLQYRDECVSNALSVSHIVKRQAAHAKRQQYHFET